jgi:hypothetical protein
MEIPFDGILTLLIFLVGIPALVLQLISATERRAVLKNQRLDVRSFLFRALLVLLIGITIQFFIAWPRKIEEQIANRDLIEQIIWLGVFGVLFVFALQVAKQIPEQYGRREKIIEKLTKEILRETQVKGRVAGVVYSDLAILGKNCDPGQEREMVVNAFKEIVKSVLSSSKYSGSSFEVLIDDLIHILVISPSPADLTNYDTAVEILSAILATGHRVDRDEDIRRSIHAISKLGQTLVTHFNSVERNHIILKGIDSLELAMSNSAMLTEVSQALFEIGSTAMEGDQIFVVAATMGKMSTLAENRSPLPVEFVADLCGLISYYWVKDGSRKRFAKIKFNEVEKYLPRNLIPTLTNARDHLITTMYFDEANNLSQMIKDIKSKPKPRRKK